MPNKKPNPTTIRAPQRTRDLLTAIRALTGMTATQVVINAIELYAAKVGITI
jgi:uncharacterized protein (DUF1778 family)